MGFRRVRRVAEILLRGEHTRPRVRDGLAKINLQPASKDSGEGAEANTRERAFIPWACALK